MTGTNMTTRTTSKSPTRAGDSRNEVSVNDTFWGYVIRPGRKVVSRAAKGEMAASFAGVLLAMASYGQWLLPGAINSPEVLPFKIASTVVFAMFACFLYLIARRGLCYEVQIDKQRKVLRTARRNRHGSSTQIDTVAFQDISSVFIQRSKSPVTHDRLYVRQSSDQKLIEVASGSETALRPVMDRMTEDLRASMVQKTVAPANHRAPVRARRAKSAFAAL